MTDSFSSDLAYCQRSAWLFWPTSEGSDRCSPAGSAWCLDRRSSPRRPRNFSSLKSTRQEDERISHLRTGGRKDARRRRRRPTCHVGLTVVVQASSGHRLAAKQGVAVKVVAELLQEAQDVRDAADGGQGQGVLLLVEVRCAGGDRRTPSAPCHTFTFNTASRPRGGELEPDAGGRVPHLR